MRIAICLSGQARFAESNFQHTYENLIKPCQEANAEVDIFCHFWSTIDQEQGMDPYLAAKIYKAKTAIIEEQEKFDDKWLDKYSFNSDLDKWMYRRISSMFRSNARAIQMATNNFGWYDCIIKARTDLIFKNKFDPQEFLTDTDALWCYDDRIVDDGIRLFGDEITWGNRWVMNCWSNCFQFMDGTIRKTEKIRPEVILYHTLKDSGISNCAKKSKIGQPDIRRNEALHTKRVEALLSGKAPVGDE